MFFFSAGGLSPTKEKRAKSAKIYRFEAGSDYSCHLMMVALQHGHTDLCCIYDMRTNTAPYCPLFDIKTHKPIHAYYSLAAFNLLYRLGNQVETACDEKRLYVLAASNGRRHAALLVNLSGRPQEFTLEGVSSDYVRYSAIDQQRLLSWSPETKTIDNNSVLLLEWQD